MASPRKTDPFGALLGTLVFLGGVALLLVTFKIAYEMLTIPPADAVGITPGKPVDLARSGQSFIGLLQRVILLVVMAGVGSVISNRGIKLYFASRATPAETHAP